MSSMFGGGDATPPVPTPDNSAEEMAAAAEAQRQNRSRAATILTSPAGLLSEPQTASTVLMGT